jgi:hypothetical protein
VKKTTKIGIYGQVLWLSGMVWGTLKALDIIPFWLFMVVSGIVGGLIGWFQSTFDKETP